MPFELKSRPRADAIAALKFPPAIVGWNRLEGRPRTVQFDRALRAEVRDALWFLTRQWQFGEFKGEDAGSPVDVRTAVRVDPLQHYAVDRRPRRSPTTRRCRSRPTSSASRSRSTSSSMRRSRGTSGG